MSNDFEHEREFIIRSIEDFLSGNGGDRDWDTFTSIPLKNRKLEIIRKKTIEVYLPIDADGEQVLKSLILEAKEIKPKDP